MYGRIYILLELKVVHVSLWSLKSHSCVSADLVYKVLEIDEKYTL